MRPATCALQRWNPSARLAASPFSVCGATGLTPPHPIGRTQRRTEALVGGSPGLQGAARAGKPLGRLTLGEALGLPTVIPLTQRSACDTIPALVAILVAVRRILHDWAHRDLLCSPSAFVYVMAKDGEVAFSFQPFGVSRYSLAEVVFETKWPTR